MRGVVNKGRNRVMAFRRRGFATGKRTTAAIGLFHSFLDAIYPLLLKDNMQKFSTDK